MRKWLPSLVAVALFAGVAWSARNSSGTYTLPAGNPVVTGTIIASQWANTTLSDLATEVTNSLDRQGRGAMLAPLQLFTGSPSAPGLTWAADLTTGFSYSGSGNAVRLSNGGSLTATWALTGNSLTCGSSATGSCYTVTGGSAGLFAVNATAGANNGQVGLIARGAASPAAGPGVIGIGADGGYGSSVPVPSAWGAEGGIFAGGLGSPGVTAIGGGFVGGSNSGAGAGLYATAPATAPGISAAGGGASIPGNVLANNQVSTATTRYGAVALLNSGDLYFQPGGSYQNPNIGVPFTNALTGKNLVKAWGVITPSTCDNSTTAGISDGFNLTKCRAQSLEVDMTLASGLLGTTDVVIGNIFTSGVAFYGGVACFMNSATVVGCEWQSCTITGGNLSNCAFANPTTGSVILSFVVLGTQ